MCFKNLKNWIKWGFIFTVIGIIGAVIGIKKSSQSKSAMGFVITVIVMFIIGAMIGKIIDSIKKEKKNVKKK